MLSSKIIKDESRHFCLLDELHQHFFPEFRFGVLPVNSNILSDCDRVTCTKDTIALLSLTHEAKGLDAGPTLMQKIDSLPEKEFR